MTSLNIPDYPEYNNLKELQFECEYAKYVLNTNSYTRIKEYNLLRREYTKELLKFPELFEALCEK
jgi:hypothetical protein